jgi:uncharacterized protein YndB with AHSA1/START domain
MMTVKTDASALEMKRTLRAPVDRVFKAWTEPEQMTKWFGCAQTGSLKVEQDFRVGGEYRIELHIDDAKSVVMSGTFFEIDPNRKLVYSWNSTSTEYPAHDTIVRVDFIDQGETTELILNHSKFNKPIAVEGHSMGWGASLDKFEALFV